VCPTLYLCAQSKGSCEVEGRFCTLVHHTGSGHLFYDRTTCVWKP
jgi:hypothetical protein